MEEGYFSLIICFSVSFDKEQKQNEATLLLIWQLNAFVSW